MNRMTDLVSDWGGFEELVKELHKTGRVTVERNVKLIGNSGQKRQIDVLIKHQEGLYKHTIIAECKYWNSEVKRFHVDALATAMQDLNASKGVIFTTKGFQSGAIGQAEHLGINLYVVRDLTDEEWGRPGRTIDFHIQYISRSIRNIKLNMMLPETMTTPPEIHLYVGNKDSQSQTLLLLQDGSKDKALEEHIIASSLEAMQKVMEESFILNSGVECTRYMEAHVPVNFLRPRFHWINKQPLMINSLRFDLLLKIHQTRFVLDRAKPFTYALMVEDCVSGNKYIASRRIRDENSTIDEIKPKPISPQDGDVLENGSIMRIFLSTWFDPKEVEGLDSVPLSERKNKIKVPDSQK